MIPPRPADRQNRPPIPTSDTVLNVSVVLLAAGAGRRFGKQKQFLGLGRRPLFHWPLNTFHRVASVTDVVLVVPSDRVGWAQRYAARQGFKKVSAVVAGGAQRADSVRRGLGALGKKFDVVLIHDSARALVTPDIVDRVAQAAHRCGAALAARPVADTIKVARAKNGRFYVRRTVSREGLWLAQTPQGLRRDVAERVASRLSATLTDDVQAAERLGIPVELVAGSAANFKVTVPEDFQLCRALFNDRE